MECNRDEALRAKAIAERKYAAKDLAGAKKFLLKALHLHPALEGAPQLLAVVEVELVTQRRITQVDFDWYGILQVDQVADEVTIKKQYRKLALALHPDKNKLAGAEAAFKLVGEANGVLADRVRRQQFDLRKVQSHGPAAASNGYNATGANGSTSEQDAFWTTCTGCKMGFQYKREYLNIRVQCQKCRSFFITKEDAVQNNSFPHQPGVYQDRAVPKGFSGGINFPNFAHHAAANLTNISSYRACKRSVTVTTANVNATGSGANKEAPEGGAKAADVVQQTFEKVKRERVEAERRQDKERRRKSKEEQDKSKVKPASRGSHDTGEPTPIKADCPLEEAAPKLDSEKKGSRSRKRHRRKDSDEDDMEVEVEEHITGGDEDLKDHEGKVGGDAHVTALRRSLRTRNPNVAYTFGDSEDEDDHLVDLLASKKPRLPHDTGVTNQKDEADVQNVEAKLPTANGHAEAGIAAQQEDKSARPDEVTNSSERTGVKGHPVIELSNKDKKDEVRCKAESGGRGDRISQGHSTKPDQRESTEAEWHEYLSKGDRRERQVVNLINSPEVRESMKRGQAHTVSTPKSVDKGKKVMAGGVSGTCEEGQHQATGLQSDHAHNAAPPTGNSGKGPSITDEVLKRDRGSRSKNVPLKTKSPGGSGTYSRRSAAVQEKQQDIQTSFAGRFLRRSNATASSTRKPAQVSSTEKEPMGTRPTYSSDDDPVDILVPDTQFHMFDNDRSEADLTPGQIWAIYDDYDGMPRFYCKITSVEPSPFKVGMQWLEPFQLPKRGSEWVASTQMALSCGDFKLGKATQADQVNIFSHVVVAGKGLRNVIKVYPRKHDVWALYKDWHKKWPGAGKHGSKHIQYDMVEVTSDYCEDMGVDVAPLVQVPGFRAIFKRSPGVVDSYKPKDLLRFSHRVPAHRMTGNEAPNMPKDSWELDTASMPMYLISQPV